MKKPIASSRFVNWSRHLSVLLVVALLLPFMATGPKPEVTPRAQPILLQMAAERPGEVLNVIVQKTAQDASVEKLVVQLGGTVTQDLSIINAFAAELPSTAVPELAEAKGVRWVSLDAPVEAAQRGGGVVFTTWATEVGSAVDNTFVNPDGMADSAQGPNGSYGYGGRVRGSFTGFSSEVTPGNVISKVELVLHGYVPTRLSMMSNPKVTVVVGGVARRAVLVNRRTFDAYIGAQNAGTLFIDITNTRAWRWADLNNGLEIVIDQSSFRAGQLVYYDAIGLRVTSTPGYDQPGGSSPVSLPATAIHTERLRNTYNFAVRATDVWNEAPAYLQGQGVTVAVVDSGAVRNRDLGKRNILTVNFNKAYHSAVDRYGHGTFVSSVIAGDGAHSGGQYVGIAPQTNVVGVRVSDDEGRAIESDVVKGLQWVLENKTRFNIRVVNLSLNSSMAQSHHTSPMDAAAEILWFNGIVVVVSAGNNGSADLYPPANDPFVITVGATDDLGTPGVADDVIASFSAYGTLPGGTLKPDLVAPGTDIIAYLPSNNKLTIGTLHSANRINNNYFRMSGTSMAAPVVSGAVAILLQDEPGLTPDQVKYRLMSTAVKGDRWPGYDPVRAGAGYLDIYAAVHGATVESTNTGLPTSQLLWTGSDPVNWGSVNWNSVNWNSVNWNSVNWNSVNWNSVNWNSDYWGTVK